MALPRGARVRAGVVRERLAELYPEAECELVHASPFQLLAATILSAQSTDANVNRVTPALFARFPTADDLAHADPDEVLSRVQAVDEITPADLMVEALGEVMPERAVAGSHVSFPAWTLRAYDERWGKETIIADILGGGTGYTFPTVDFDLPDADNDQLRALEELYAGRVETVLASPQAIANAVATTRSTRIPISRAAWRSSAAACMERPSRVRVTKRVRTTSVTTPTMKLARLTLGTRKVPMLTTPEMSSGAGNAIWTGCPASRVTRSVPFWRMRPAANEVRRSVTSGPPRRGR